jgi:lysophospholipase L1-like esterase
MMSRRSPVPVADPTHVRRRLTGRRRAAFAIVAALLAASLCAAVLVAADVYLHARVQDVAGVNVWGYRGPVIGRKRPDEIRIVALGGSTTFGFGLFANESWPFYLGELLNSESAAGRYRVVNLGAPGQGAYGFAFDLADYAYLHYDLAVLYEGYNDLGRPMAFDPTPGVVNHYLWRRQSPVYLLTGYFPILPLVFREKAMALRSGGDLDAAYRGEIRFKAGVAARMTASALAGTAAAAEAIGQRFGRFTGVAALSHAPIDSVSWKPYTDSVLIAVEYARARGVRVLVVTQPYLSDAHVAQQRALAAALSSRFASDAGVRYVNLGTAVNLQDHTVAYDGLHLVAAANRSIAERLVDPVRSLSADVAHDD